MHSFKAVNYFILLIFSLVSFQTIASSNKNTNQEVQLSDSMITNTVKANIKKELSLTDVMIEVVTKDGIIVLSGSTNSDTEASKAIEIAGSTKGVKDVDASNLKIKESKKPWEDTLITAKVKGAFIREELFGKEPVAAISISVETVDGVVYLSGTAKASIQAENAQKIAQKITGVKKVESTITVGNKLENHQNKTSENSTKENSAKKGNMH